MNTEQIVHMMSLVDEFAFVAGLCGIDHARDGNSNGRKAEFNDARQRVEDAIAALSAEGGAVSVSDDDAWDAYCAFVDVYDGDNTQAAVRAALERFAKTRHAAAATGDMVLVPREMTDAMREAAMLGHDDVDDAWAVLIAAAKQEPQ